MLRKTLFKFCIVVIFVLSCSKDKNSVGPSVPITNNIDMAQQTHTLINDYRLAQGLSSLTYNQVIADVALEHSRNMAMGTVEFSHDGFNTRI